MDKVDWKCCEWCFLEPANFDFQQINTYFYVYWFREKSKFLETEETSALNKDDNRKCTYYKKKLY